MADKKTLSSKKKTKKNYELICDDKLSTSSHKKSVSKKYFGQFFVYF